jgi:phosphoribosylformimino-5-aminoimidazole carboxamide ribonucleotide (ProFAR) isomerase
MTLELLPAVDLLDGQAARLVQGVAGTDTGYGDPVEAAQGFAADGAHWLHVVDLDAAFGRGPRNRGHLGRIVEAVGPVRVEASGGVRTPDDLHALFDLGAARVVIGTAALEDPAWVAEACARHGEAVAVGLDAEAGPSRPAAGRPAAATCSRRWGGWRERAAAGSSTPRWPGTGCSPARPPTAWPRSWPPPAAR